MVQLSLSSAKPARMEYSEALQFVLSFPDMERGTHGARGATMSLDAMRSLLQRMGDPQNGRHTVHVTGSKGKGSTSTMIASILRDAGYRTALFTSPHLQDYTERFAFDMEPISQAQFAAGIEEIMPVVKEEAETGSAISTFGVLTALFFHLVRKAQPPIDWQIVEVGMGGRFDATNVFETKEVAVITAISLEHIEYLGTNQSEIATNKAGIITPRCLAVVGPQKDPAVRSVIGRRAHEMSADMVYVPKVYKIKPVSHDFSGQTFTLEGPGGPLTLSMHMLGEHQIANAATAVAACKGLADRGFPINDDSIKSGIANARLPGRLELAQVNGKSPHILLDGAHNHESAAGLAAGIKALFPGKQCIFVIGVGRDKNINAIWRELLPLSKMVIATKSGNQRAMDVDALAEQLSFQSSLSHVQAKTAPSVAEALELGISLAGPDDVVCVTGSLYVVAEARAHLKLEHSTSR